MSNSNFKESDELHRQLESVIAMGVHRGVNPYEIERIISLHMEAYKLALCKNYENELFKLKNVGEVANVD